MNQPPTQVRPRERAPGTRTPHSNVRRLGFVGDDLALADALKQGHPGAPAELFERYGNHIQRVLVNVMGVDQELPDLLQETFARAFKNAGQLEDGARLKAWLTRIAVFTARGCIRSRGRKRWLRYFSPETMPETRARVTSMEDREAVKSTYKALDAMPADLRVPFTLRYMQGMSLKEVAAACEVSLATIKRRLAKADKRFISIASREPALQSWLEGGSRWANE